MNQVIQHNIGAVVQVLRASAAAAALAAGTGDATSTTGTTIDRMNISGSGGRGGMPNSALFSVIYDATLASGKTLSLIYAIQDSADNSTWADYATPAAATIVATGASGGSVAAGQFNVAVDLHSAKRYVRINTKPDLDNTATDTAVTRSVVALGGFVDLPSPN